MGPGTPDDRRPPAGRGNAFGWDVGDRGNTGNSLEGSPRDQDPYQDQEAAEVGVRGSLAPRAEPWTSVAPHSEETRARQEHSEHGPRPGAALARTLFKIFYLSFNFCFK